MKISKLKNSIIHLYKCFCYIGRSVGLSGRWINPEEHSMKVGLVGYGKAGSAVAGVLQQDPRYELQWVATRSGTPELAHVHGTQLPLVALQSASFGDWLDAHPVDALVGQLAIVGRQLIVRTQWR